MKRFGIFFTILCLSGCVPVLPPLNFSVPNVGVTRNKIDAELKSLTVSVARPDEKTGLLPNGIEHQVPELWSVAITEALNKMAVFQDDSTKKITISVKILKLAPQGLSTITTETSARYEIIDRKNGDIIFTSDITSTGVTPGDYAFVGNVRLRESINRAVQNNISLFLQALDNVDINKPMFPVSKR